MTFNLSRFLHCSIRKLDSETGLDTYVNSSKTTNGEIEFGRASSKEFVQNLSECALEYDYNKDANAFTIKQDGSSNDEQLKNWFCME